jgi:hypothetical protein
MPTRISPTDLASRIQTLLEQRQVHADAITHIDQTMAGVIAALSGEPAKPQNGKAIAPVASPAPRVKGKRRRGRGHFALSAEESILAFVKEHRSATSSEISAHLNGEGRSASASNALGKLVNDRKLKRQPLEGQRGSRYALA